MGKGSVCNCSCRWGALTSQLTQWFCFLPLCPPPFLSLSLSLCTVHTLWLIEWMNLSSCDFECGKARRRKELINFAIGWRWKMRGLLLRSSFSSLLLFRKSPPFPFPLALMLSSSAPFSSDSNSNSKLNIFDRQLKRIQVPTFLPLFLVSLCLS